MRTPRKDRKSTRARNAISTLFSHLREHPENAARIIAHARAYSIRHRVPILTEERILYCPECKGVYGPDSKRRIKNTSIFIHCEHCSALRRLRVRTSATNHRAPRTRSAKT